MPKANKKNQFDPFQSSAPIISNNPKIKLTKPSISLLPYNGKQLGSLKQKLFIQSFDKLFLLQQFFFIIADKKRCINNFSPASSTVPSWEKKTYRLPKLSPSQKSNLWMYLNKKYIIIFNNRRCSNFCIIIPKIFFPYHKYYLLISIKAE